MFIEHILLFNKGAFLFLLFLKNRVFYIIGEEGYLDTKY
jgi:hypothetical protein